MPRSVMCPKGHQWLLSESSTLAEGSKFSCPVCGAEVEQGVRTLTDAGRALEKARFAGKAPAADPYATRPASADPSVPVPGTDRPTLTDDPAPAPDFRTRASGVSASTHAPSAPAEVAHEVWPVLPGYEIRAELGRGGMGIVYRAYDCQRREEVALKTLQGMSSAALVRFKQEFRLLTDVSHPNLVSLYELISDGQQWFFTMELLEGRDFLAFVRSGPGPASVKVPGLRGRPLTTPDQEQRLRQMLGQLTEGLLALHAAGKLHRDIKPSNVLITPEGRVVILDFGLAAEVRHRGSEQEAERQVLGTIPYMSPEQAAARPLSPATDWYSVGVILYETLTGRLPFTGHPLQVLVEKTERDPVPPRQLVPAIPEDLNDLCVGLLRRDPRQRLSGQELLRRLGQSPADGIASETPFPESIDLLGRESQLRALSEAFQTMRGGRTVIAYVSGQSGLGKSALIQAFLDRLRQRREAVVLAGQCYEKETVPYKVFDSLVDALSRHLEQLPPAEAEALLSGDMGPLLRVFPVLRRLEALGAAQRALEIPDLQEVRRRAFAGLRQLLTRLGRRRPLVLSIDDLQWGDTDSLALFSALFGSPDPPPVLLIGSFRSEEAPTNPFLRSLLACPTGEVDRRDVAVGVLSQTEAKELALRLGGPGTLNEDSATAIALESGGNPLFVSELVQHALAQEDKETGRVGRVFETHQQPYFSLSSVLAARMQRLPAEARRLLEVLAVGGRPLRQTDAIQAAELTGDERAIQTYLRTGRLIRAIRTGGEELLAVYHDRIRETLTARLEADVLQDCHRRLALTLEASGHADPEALAQHFQGAHQPEKAITYFQKAADKAVAALAFDRAAEFYQSILHLLPQQHPDRRRLRGKLADALANARRGIEAAPEFLAAAEGAEATEALELRRRAAEQYLYSGHLDEGRAVIQTLLASLGMKLPKTPRRALVSILYHRFLLWLRGLGFRERSASDLSPEELVRIDTCWSIGLGLSHVDPIRGAEFQSRYLLMALRAGEPSRILRGLAIETGQRASGGGKARRKTEQLLQVTRALCDRVQEPYGTGLTWVACGSAAFMEGRWQEARDNAERAERILREQCLGAACERNEANFYAIRSLEFLGELKELSRRLTVLLKDAEDRGDLYAATNLRTRLSYFVSLMHDQPEQAQQDLRSAIERWSRQTFFLQHYFELYAQMDISHYRGDFQEAWDFVNGRWPALRRSLILLVQSSRLTSYHVRARSALGLAALPTTTPARRKKLLRLAEKDALRIAREDMGWSNPIALLLRAGIAATRGRNAEAQTLLEQAEAGFLKADMALYAAVARRRLGQLRGPEGKELVEAADRWMLDQSISNPARWTSMYAPGFPEAEG